MLSMGIVGLPNVGKSTLFQALTQKQVEIANYPFTTINPNVGVVPVPDERLERIVALLKPAEHYPAVVEFVDIAGLVKGAHAGEGLGNQFLSHIYAVDAILFLIRAFKDKNIASSSQGPAEEIATLREELEKKDKQIAEKEGETPFLAQKPSIVGCNIKKDGENLECENYDLKIDAKLELEMAEMDSGEIAELGLESSLPQLIEKTYQTLGLITFYTIKRGKEVRAWPLKKGAKAPEAGAVVHTDFEEKFIRAEVIQSNKLLEAGSWASARDKGWLRTEGKDYVVQDGDIIEFKI